MSEQGTAGWERHPWGVRRIVRWSEESLRPKEYWGDRYEDVLFERVDGFLSGCIFGAAAFLAAVLIGMAVGAVL